LSEKNSDFSICNLSSFSFYTVFVKSFLFLYSFSFQNLFSIILASVKLKSIILVLVSVIKISLNCCHYCFETYVLSFCR